MGRNPMDRPVEVPKWDVALEALITDEYRRLKRPLQVADFRRLAQAHKIRFHDIMETVQLLDRHGRWCHQGTAADGTVPGLYVHSRVDEDVAERGAVSWSPRGPA